MASRSSLVVNARVHLSGSRGRSAVITNNVEYVATREGADKSATVDDLRRSELAERMGIVGYCAERPGSTALFDQNGAVQLRTARRELEKADGAIATVVLSVRRDEACELDLACKEDWQRFCRRNLTPALAEAMGIPESSVRWVAAEHENHPNSKHVHVIAWSSDGSFDSLMARNRLDRARNALTDAALVPALAAEHEARDLARSRAVDAVRHIPADEIGVTLPADGRISYAHLRRWHPDVAKAVDAAIEEAGSRHPEIKEASAAYRESVERCAGLKGLEGVAQDRYLNDAMHELRARQGNALLRVIAPDRATDPEREPIRSARPDDGPATERKRMRPLVGEVRACVTGKDLEGARSRRIGRDQGRCGGHRARLSENNSEGNDSMSKQKSFNVDEGAHLKRCVAAGAAAGAAIALVLLPAAWRWLEAWVVGIAATLTSFGMAAVPELPGTMFQNPLEVLPELIRDDVFLVGCAATLTVSIAVGIWSHLDWSRWFHDGTWVGGRRAPGAPIHGDARLVSAHSELKRRSESWQEGGKPSGGTLVVGEIGRSVRLIDSVHACVLAESGEGKSRRVAILSALANFEQGRSLIINDIKGELRAFLEPVFEKTGTHRIVDVMFDAPASSVRFDPLERAKEAFGAEGAGGCARELRELARCIVPAPSKSQPFFYDGARNLFVGISLALIEDASIPEDEKTVMSVAAAISPSGDQGPLDRIAALAASLPAEDPALPFLGGLNGEHGGGPGIVSTLSNCLTEYVDGNVARMLHDDECGLGGIGEEPTVVFISSSSATGNYKRLVQTFVSQALSALRSCAAGHAGRCPVETVLLLDEAASLGRNERIVQDLGEMRSEGVHVLWFCQSLLQLQSVSGYSREEAETILDLLKDKVVLSCSNLDTARKLSESMGSYTAVAQSTSRTKGTNTGSTGTSEGLVRRPLITPDELQRWTGRETGALVIHDGVPMAFPSRDVTETFVGPMLGMTSPDAERTLMERSTARRKIRNETAPRVWRGPTAPDATSTAPTKPKTAAGYVPEGF